MEIQAVVASTVKDSENGWSYSDSALTDLAKTAQGKPINYERRRIGIIESAKHESGKVTVTALISKPEEILNKTLYLVPGGLTDFDTIGDIINTCVAHQFFFTDQPSDKTLTVFERIDY